MAEAKTVVAVKAGAPVMGLVPRSIEEAWRLAQAIAGSDLAPKDMQRPEKILVAIMGGAELGLPPFQALQSFAVINGRPTLWGDGLLGVVRARSVKVKEWYDGEGDAMVARCEVTRPDTEEVIAGEFSVDDAKKAGLWSKSGPWSQYPKRMLKMRARAFAIRDGCADMLRGIQVREEVQDYAPIRDVTPPSEQLALESHAEEAEIEIIDATPIPPAPVEPPPPEAVEAQVEANALTDAPTPERPRSTPPSAAKATFATKWATTWRERIADPDATGPAVSTQWSSPDNGRAIAKAKAEDAALVQTVTDEVLALVATLETA